MPFLLPNQQRQSTEGKTSNLKYMKNKCSYLPVGRDSEVSRTCLLVTNADES